MFNPGTSFVMDVAEIYHRHENGLSDKSFRKIITLMDVHLKQEYFHEYFAAKTFFVLELLHNLVQGRYPMAESLYTLVRRVHNMHIAYSDQLDIGKNRVQDFVLSEVVDGPGANAHLLTPEGTEIVLGLLEIGYNFHMDFVRECSDEFIFAHNL